MPIYEYKCEKGHIFDVMQRMADDPLTACVECGASVRKVLHPVGISFKGSGFYSTDYSTKSSKEPTSKDTSSASTNGDSNSGSEKSTEKSADASKSTGKKD